MKKIITFLTAILFIPGAFSQAPQKMSYQAVIRNSSGQLVTGHAVGMRISILQGSAAGTAVYVETQTPTTNANGLATIEVGGGTIVTGTFTGINWAAAAYYLKTEADPAGGTSYTIVGTSQLLSVPYSLFAKTVQTEADPTWSGAANQTGEIGRTGNVGIGTLTPSARLDVAGGDAMVNELTVGKGGGSQLSNTSIGYSALSSNTSGIYNTAVGNAVMYNNTEGNENSAFGFRALFTNTTGKQNTAIGIRALFFNLGGISNTAMGNEALYANTQGDYNTANGAYVLHKNTTGVSNTGTGFAALNENITGTHNTALGSVALNHNKTGSENTAIGTNALYSNETGKQNTAIGSMALFNNSGNENTANGYKSLYYNTTGVSNTAIGHSSGVSSTLFLTGENNTFVGTNTDYTDGTINNSTAIGANVILTHSNTVILGKDANVGIGTTNPAHKLDVTGIANLNKGIASGVALRCNGAEALWYNGTYFSWGHDASYNYFADPVTIGTAGTPSYMLVVNGDAAKTGGGNWSVLSDFRLKDMTGNYEKGLKEILDLKAIRFTYKEFNPRHLDSDEEQIGFIAQDVQKIFPEAVNQCKDGYLDFNMHAVNVAMVNAIRELKAENDRLKAENEQFNLRLTKLEALFSHVNKLIIN